MARSDMMDAEWAVIEPLLPVAATGSLPRRVRDQFNGVLWRFRAGSGWRDVPDRYGPWSTVYSRFSTWARAGVFQDLMDALIAEAEAVPDAEKVPRATVGRPRRSPDRVLADNAYPSRPSGPAFGNAASGPPSRNAPTG